MTGGSIRASRDRVRFVVVLKELKRKFTAVIGGGERMKMMMIVSV